MKIEAANLKRGGVTPLTWDIAAVSQELTFEGEVVVCWEPTYGYGYDHSYCLVFRKQAEGEEDGRGASQTGGFLAV